MKGLWEPLSCKPVNLHIVYDLKQRLDIPKFCCCKTILSVDNCEIKLSLLSIKMQIKDYDYYIVLTGSEISVLNVLTHLCQHFRDEEDLSSDEFMQYPFKAWKNNCKENLTIKHNILNNNNIIFT